jgi:hypothetical protein
MQVQYEMTPEDFVAFNAYHQKNSPELRRRLNISRIAIPLVMLLAFLAMPLIKLDQGESYVEKLLELKWFFLAPVILYFYTPFAWRRRNAKLIRNMLREGSTKALLGDCTITISDDGIASVRKSSSSSVGWDVVDRIVENDQYGFIYLSSLSAVLIPRRAFQRDEDYESFMQHARNYHGGPRFFR